MSEIVTLKRFLTAQPRLTESEQTKLLVDLLASERDWLAALLAAHGFKAHERLAFVPLLDTRPLFRVRKVDQLALYNHVRARRWSKLAKLPINSRFVRWSKPHA